LLGKKKHFTVFWYSPKEGYFRKIHLRWQLVFWALVVFVVGVGAGVGGVLWYQSRMRRELCYAVERAESLKKEIVLLENQKKEQEEQLQALNQKAQSILQELSALRELDQKVRSLLEKDLQSRFNKIGINLSLAGASPEIYVPLDRFMEMGFPLFVVGAGGPLFMEFPSATLPVLPRMVDPTFAQRSRMLDDTLSWMQAEILARQHSFEEILQVIQRKEELLNLVPMRWPTWGRVSSNFGWRKDPFTGLRAWHTGVDIAAPLGRNVVSTAEGKVVFAGWNGNYGKCVIVRHQFGYETVYGHLSQILVRVGDQVKKNQIIGKVGSTGRSTGPHLHYEVRRYGKVINPWPYLP